MVMDISQKNNLEFDVLSVTVEYWVLHKLE